MAVFAARLLAVLTLLATIGLSLWPAVLGAQWPLAGWAAVPPVIKLELILLALALGLSTTRDEALAKRFAAGALALAALSLLSWLITLAAGTPAVVGPVREQSFFVRLLALRPTALTTLGLTALATALLLRREEPEGFDVAALLGSLAAGVFALICLGHLYGAPMLILGPDRLTAGSAALGALLLLALSLSALALHPAGPLAAYTGDGPGPVAKRRLLPAAVMTPIASGFLLVYALTGQRLSPTLAVALVVFANVLVMLLLIDGAGNKVERLARDRQERSERREALARKQGLRDPMTALVNRRGWDEEVEIAERRCLAEGLNACVVVIDMDGLKQVNDSEGHKAGDALIQRAAAALRKAARRGDTLARLGGDEFAYLAAGCDESDARAVVARFEDSLRAARVSASVGCAMRGRRSLDQTFEEADQAMYQQKRARKLRRA